MLAFRLFLIIFPFVSLMQLEESEPFSEFELSREFYSRFLCSKMSFFGEF